MSALERKFWEAYKKEAPALEPGRLDELFLAYSGLIDYSKEVLNQLAHALHAIPIGVAIRHWLIHHPQREEYAQAFLTLAELKIIPLENEAGKVMTLSFFFDEAGHQKIITAIKALKKRSKQEKELLLNSYEAFASYLQLTTLGLIKIN